jgi:uncharacterized protein (TIGR00269 family)
MMKCRKCGGTAVINMRQHRLALCEPHFLEWVPQQVQKSIQRYQMFAADDRVLVAVSGGKDSLSLWDILLRLGYRADGLYLGLGIDDGIAYSVRSLEKVHKFIAGATRDSRQTVTNSLACLQEGEAPETLGFVPTLHVVDIEETYGYTIPEIARQKQRGRNRPCAVCGLIKRHEMNRVAAEMGYNVLATGHNLDDEAAVLFGNVLNWQIGYLARQAPALPEGPGLARKVKPLCRMYEREMAAYVLTCGIDYIYDECPYAEGATSLYHKELLNRLEAERPGAKQQFYLSFLQAREETGFLDGFQEELEMHPCERCGQPTTAPGMCAFCRLWIES